MAKLVYTDPSGRELTVPLGPESPVVSIGRATDCTVRSNRKSVSRKHAEFRYDSGRYEVVDLNSSNGTYIIVDGRRQQIYEPRPLSHGDEIWCGDFILKFFEEAGESAPVQGFGQTPNMSNQGGVSGAQPAVQAGGGFGQQPSVGMGEGLVGINEGSVAEMEPSTMREPAPTGMEGGVDFGALAEDPMPESGPSVDDEELQRLRDEKASIQELADRQAREVEQLEDQLEGLRKTLEEARNDADFYRDQADEVRRAKEKVQAEVEQLRTQSAESGDSAELEEEIERLERALEGAREERDEVEDRLARAHEKIDDLRLDLDSASEGERQARKLKQKLEEREDTLKRKRNRIDELERRADRLQEQLEAAKSDTNEEEVRQLRDEVERQERLLAEYESRNRDVQRHLDEVIQERDDLDRSASDLEEALERATTARDEAQAQLEALSEEREARQKAEAELEALRENEGCLKSEVEGLKQRLRLEKKRAREAEAETGGDEAQVEALEEEVASLEEEVATLQEALEEARQTGASEEAAPANGVDLDRGQLSEQAQNLKRVVDAIERADLSELSTVDRVRLQSALRETSPADILSAMLDELVSQ